MNIVKVTVRTPTGKESLGEVRIQTWDQKTRIKRAVKFLVICWALSIFSIALPIVHFFLVPALFLAGPIGAYIVGNQKSVVLGGESTCPECKASLPLVRCADRWPLTDLCAKCQKSVVIERA